jgi:hypothetical protein
MEFATQRVVDEVMRATTGMSEAAADLLRKHVGRAAQTVLGQCARPSAAMADYLRVVRQRSRSALGPDDLDAVMTAYSAWAGSVGAGKVTQALTDALEDCRLIQTKLDASYRTWWRRSETGRVWWLELRFHNGFSRGLFATLSGRARVTQMSGRSGRSADGVPRAQTLQWGAGSGDYAPIPPGSSRHLVRLWGNGPYVTTGPSGTFRVENVEVSTDLLRARSWWCSLQVPECS